MSDARMLYVSKLKECDNPMNELFNILTEALNFNTPNSICGALYLIKSGKLVFRFFYAHCYRINS